MDRIFALFAGRHPIPGNPPAIFPENVNPMDFDELHAAAQAAIPSDCTSITVYVTGLTPAMLAVVEVCFQRGITLEARNYNRETGEYQSQFPVVFDRCPFCGKAMSRFAYFCPHCGGGG